MRWTIILLVSCLVTLAGNVLAQTATSKREFIQNIKLFTSQDSSANVDRTQIPIFKQLLEQHGYGTDNCKEAREGVQTMTTRASPDQPGSYERVGKRALFVAAIQCEVPNEDVLVYDAELVLDVDPVLKNRRAVLRFVPIGPGKVKSGGYAHKPGELASWYDMVSRAIERTLAGFNEPTSIRLVLPEETRVGDTLRLDARSSWDPDGDAFELRWNITTKGCFGSKDATPIDGHPCPRGTVKGSVKVQDQAGLHELTREFRVPMVGDYEVRVHAKIGAREEPDRIYRIRAYPRRSNVFFSRVGYRMLPTDFLGSTGEREPALLINAGYLGRVAHRIGFFDRYEEVYWGFSLGALENARSFNFKGESMAALVGVEAIARTLDRTGRFGFANSLSLNGGMIRALRGDYVHTEAAVVIEGMAGFYFLAGGNYVDKSVAYCAGVCPGITVGPTLSLFQNITTTKLGISGGLEIVMGMEY
ncbi:hypothetical protein [Sorangium sp. So ce117]|uniref:hypothetical protein n=1 Tax=Sorangium sp. So ce117 TaxID=3133277 RepID=UPI003F5FD06F